jgi:hypothetical protein
LTVYETKAGFIRIHLCRTLDPKEFDSMDGHVPRLQNPRGYVACRALILASFGAGKVANADDVIADYAHGPPNLAALRVEA